MILQFNIIFLLCGIIRKGNLKTIKSKEFTLPEINHQSYYFMPQCFDKPESYECHCGPGFTWNTHSCIANGLNSYFEFPTDHSTLHYAMISNQPVSQLANFTVAFWLQVFDVDHKGVILSYSSISDNTTMFAFQSGPTLSMRIYSLTVTTSVKLKTDKWTHLLWSWTIAYGIGKWNLVVNGHSKESGEVSIDYNLRTASRGFFILGHPSFISTAQNNIHDISENLCCRFKGNIGFINMWSYQLTKDEVTNLINDCKLNEVGDVFQWSNFRAETRGIKLRWPSNIFDTKGCFSATESLKSCDKYCSTENGPKCQEEVLENILWLRTPVNATVKLPCPYQLTTNKFNETPQTYMTRHCIKLSDHKGMWSFPMLDNCISKTHLFLKIQTKKLLKSLPNKENDIPNIALLLHSSTIHSKNIFDILTTVRSFNNITNAQNTVLKRFWTMLNNISNFGLNRRSDMVLYPSLGNSDRFIKVLSSVINNLLKPVYEKLWLESNPPGSQMDTFLHYIESWFNLIADTLQFHLAKGELDRPERALMQLKYENFEYKVGMFRKNIKEVFESKSIVNNLGTEYLSLLAVIKKKLRSNTHHETADNKLENEYETYSFGVLCMRNTLNTHQKNLVSQKLNSKLFLFMAHHSNYNEEYELNITFRFNKISNISQSKCVRLEHGNGIQLWNFSPSNCKVNNINQTHLTCNCLSQGFYGVLSDMFDPTGMLSQTVYCNGRQFESRRNETCLEKGLEEKLRYVSILKKLTAIVLPNVFATILLHTFVTGRRGGFTELKRVFVPPEKELNYITYPTYFGCFASIILCGITYVCLCFRNASNGPAIHRHFGISIIVNHILFMFGTEQVKKNVICLIVALAQHLFTLSSFCWLMNEAFNLYILITYSTHSRSDHLDEGGSMLKYYVIGWGFPSIFVGSFFGANMDDYLSSRMCYISRKQSLFLFVPVIIIILVTLLVLVFTVKEQMESSYSKNEKTNETISIYSKALWTQIVLMVICWLFALASLSMEGSIIKLLHAFFNMLQGIFFYIFFYHLNEEMINGEYRSGCLFKKKKIKEDIPMTLGSPEILWDRSRPRGMIVLENAQMHKDEDQHYYFEEQEELVTTV